MEKQLGARAKNRIMYFYLFLFANYTSAVIMKVCS